MSQEYCILNFLNIEDKNIKLTQNFYKVENFDGINYNQFKTSLYDTNDKISTYMKTSIKTLKKYLPHIKNTLFNPYHNGFVEGNNNFIKVLKRIAFGFRSFRRFKARIMICKNLLHMKRADA